MTILDVCGIGPITQRVSTGLESKHRLSKMKTPGVFDF